jgi:hypothetical protein
MRKRFKQFLPSLILFLIVGVILGILLGFFLRNYNQNMGLCKPGLFCLDNRLAYRDLSCGLLVGANTEVNSLCENGKLVEDHPLIRTTMGEGQPILIIDTELLDLQEKTFQWQYYPSGNADLKNVLASPNGIKVSGVFSGEENGKKIFLILR